MRCIVSEFKIMPLTSKDLGEGYEFDLFHWRTYTLRLKQGYTGGFYGHLPF